jgi:hypothetical protein
MISGEALDSRREPRVRMEGSPKSAINNGLVQGFLFFCPASPSSFLGALLALFRRELPRASLATLLSELGEIPS